MINYDFFCSMTTAHKLELTQLTRFWIHSLVLMTMNLPYRFGNWERIKQIQWTLLKQLIHLIWKPLVSLMILLLICGVLLLTQDKAERKDKVLRAFHDQIIEPIVVLKLVKILQLKTCMDMICT